MIRDSLELQAREDCVDGAVPETKVFAAAEESDRGKEGGRLLDLQVDPVAGLRAYLGKIDR
jgi:hypothetical protein